MSSTRQDNRLYIPTCSSVGLLKVLIGKLKLRTSSLKLWHTEHTLITALLWLGSFSSELRRAPKSWTPFSLLASLSSKTGTASNLWYVHTQTLQIHLKKPPKSNSRKLKYNSRWIKLRLWKSDRTNGFERFNREPVFIPIWFYMSTSLILS